MLNIPILIIKEQGIKSEGFLDEQIFEGKLIEMDIIQPSELYFINIKSNIRRWIDEVKAYSMK